MFFQPYLLEIASCGVLLSAEVSCPESKSQRLDATHKCADSEDSVPIRTDAQCSLDGRSGRIRGRRALSRVVPARLSASDGARAYTAGF